MQESSSIVLPKHREGLKMIIYFLIPLYHYQQQTNTDQNLGPRSDIISYPYMTHPIYNYFRLVSKILAGMQKIIENQLALIKSASYIAEE